MRRIKEVVCLALCTVALGGCMTSPEELVAKQESSFLTYTDAVKAKSSVGENVKWSGVIFAVADAKSHIVLDVVHYPDSTIGRPNLKAAPTGTFRVLVKNQDAYSQATIGQHITVVGNLVKHTELQLKDKSVAHPVVENKNIHTWRQASSNAKSNCAGQQSNIFKVDCSKGFDKNQLERMTDNLIIRNNDNS